jgi:biopolymer transport protein ExbD
MIEFKRRRHRHTHLNIAPLVDVVFLLLLFFMLTSHFIQEPAIKIRLPESKVVDLVSEEFKTITITKNNEIYYLEKRVDVENLHLAIIENMKNIKDEYLRIKADKDVSVGLLVRVIDEVKLSGIKNFSIVTEKK